MFKHQQGGFDDPDIAVDFNPEIAHRMKYKEFLKDKAKQSDFQYTVLNLLVGCTFQINGKSSTEVSYQLEIEDISEDVVRLHLSNNQSNHSYIYELTPPVLGTETKCIVLETLMISIMITDINWNLIVNELIPSAEIVLLEPNGEI